MNGRASRLWQILAGISALYAVLWALPASAQQLSRYAMGPQYQVSVRGLPMNCRAYRTGQYVAIFSDPMLDDVGIASSYGNQPYIVLNPNVMARYSDLVAVWWFAHECAHHALGPMNSESNADCFAIRRMRDLGIIRRREQLIAFSQELRNLPGTAMGHLPGPLRAQHIAACALS
ncbi:hypothetical protein [Sphingosinithalassobacter portus]|uniref:hypothetical protein n=1 Tax=Stakelama portus TaxID=2676234 RepID=UPI0011AB7140|nr:hypothetical protein [Sphingosinithalassobacter portus]